MATNQDVSSDYESDSDGYDTFEEEESQDASSSTHHSVESSPSPPPSNKKRKLESSHNTHYPKKQPKVPDETTQNNHPPKKHRDDEYTGIMSNKHNHQENEKHHHRKEKPIKNNINRLGKALLTMPENKLRAMVQTYSSEDIDLVQEALVQIIGKSVSIYEDEHQIMLSHKKAILGMIGLTMNLEERKCAPTVPSVKRILLKPENHHFLLTLAEIMSRM
jgi:hypothetical protein